ncbi:MAG TPA: GAF domain-containing protein [Burkholderiaceae bacterium]|nr:GAF domain-containing protein [Burkholderiaceae bacterium]
MPAAAAPITRPAAGDPPDAPQRGSAPGPSSIRFACGLTRAEIARGRYQAEGITGAVLATGRPIIVQDIDAESRFLARAVTRGDRLPQETVTFIALPIEVNRRTVGVLGVHRIRRRHRLLDDDVALLKILATLAGQLLQLRSLVDEKARALESAAARCGIIGTSPALLQALAGRAASKRCREALHCPHDAGVARMARATQPPSCWEYR